MHRKFFFIKFKCYFKSGKCIKNNFFQLNALKIYLNGIHVLKKT